MSGNFKHPDAVRSQALALLREGLPPIQVGLRVGVNRITVAKWMRSVGLTAKHGNPSDSTAKATALLLYIRRGGRGARAMALFEECIEAIGRKERGPAG